MPHIIDPRARGSELLEVMSELVSEQGAAALTIRRIASQMGMSAAGLMHQYSNRRRLLSLFACLVLDRRHLAIDYRSYRDGPTGFLPIDEDEVRQEIAWRAVNELAREDEELADTCAWLRDRERHLLHASTGRDLDQIHLDALLAVVDGLCAALTQAARPLSPSRARAALELTSALLLTGMPVRTRRFPDFDNAEASGWFAA